MTFATPLVQRSTAGAAPGLDAQTGDPRALLEKLLEMAGFPPEMIDRITGAAPEQEMKGMDGQDLAQLVQMLQPLRNQSQPRFETMGRTLGKGGSATVGNAYQSYQNALARGHGQTNPQAKAQLDRQLAETVNVNGQTMTKGQLVDQVARKANMPPQLVAAIWKREDDQMRVDRYLHNGDPLGRPTQNEPKGIMFGKDQFIDAAVHALGQKRGIADQLGLNYQSTDRAAMAAFAEGYNGFGYRQKGVSNPYVGAGTDLYSGGMYVADHRYDASAYDRRAGVLAMV